MKTESRAAESVRDGLYVQVERMGLARRLNLFVTGGALRIEGFDWVSPERMLLIASDKPKAQTWNDAVYSVDIRDVAISLFCKPNQPFEGVLVSPGNSNSPLVAVLEGLKKVKAARRALGL